MRTAKISEYATKFFGFFVKFNAMKSIFYVHTGHYLTLRVPQNVENVFQQWTRSVAAPNSGI